MAEMMALYLQEIPPLVQAMKKAIAEQDWPALHHATHSLLPTFATMGMAPQFEESTKAMQAMAATLRSGKEVASPESRRALLSWFLPIEAACLAAAQELEHKLLALAPILALSRPDQ
jgi:HPt (histidine-containing phosphotransfer) domain-containing protein